mgnify:CR=1 FL=1
MQSEAIFAGQVTLNSLVQNLIYGSGTVGAILVVVGLLMIDAGTTRRVSVFNSTIEKVVGFFLGFTVYFLCAVDIKHLKLLRWRDFIGPRTPTLGPSRPRFILAIKLR